MGPGTRASQKATTVSRKPPQKGRGKKRGADESVVEDVVQTPNKRAARPKGAPLVGTSHDQPCFAFVSPDFVSESEPSASGSDSDETQGQDESEV